jgi:phosphoribosylformylglycinamidine cyclo-ligase
MPPKTYAEAGVNVTLGEQFVDRIKSKLPTHTKLLKASGGYAAVYPVTDTRYIAVTTDGVGTKVLLAEKFKRHHGIGIDLVAMCANDLICVGATPTLFLDYYATGKLDLEAANTLIDGILDGCQQAGMILVGGETAEMPDVYQGHHYDLAGFSVGDLSPLELITGESIASEQTIIGIASNGIHSNGLSLARKVFTDEQQAEWLLEPTLIYVKPILELFKAYRDSITGLAHITGGGLRNLSRLNQTVDYCIESPMPVLPVFTALLEAGVPEAEAYKTFNMGMGMALIVKDHSEEILAQLKRAGLQAQIVGYTQPTEASCVWLKQQPLP